MKQCQLSFARWFAAMVLFSLAPALHAGPWESLFNGRDLTGWTQATGNARYVVEQGAIVGTTAPGEANSFLITDRSFGDFILELEVTQEGGPTNSGIQFRSERQAASRNSRVFGYQCEIDPSPRAWTGGIYDEGRRDWLYPAALNPAVQPGLYQMSRWNRIRVEAIGHSLRTWVNGQPVAQVIDEATALGFIGLQIHSVKSPEEIGRRVLFRDIRIQTQDLHPSPAIDIPIRNLIPNSLSPAEAAQGWRLLWDGRTSRGWRGARQETFPAGGWKIADGELIVLESGGAESRNGGDIVTIDDFASFELQFEFKLSPGANSGVKYYVDEGLAPIGGSAIGLEYQLLDDEKHPDALLGREGNRTLGSLYDLIARGPLPKSGGITPRIGEWQSGRIVAHGDHVEHWLNGIKIVDYRRGSPAFLALVAASKYKGISGFGLAPRGRLLLQDHGNEVHYRSIKVRVLP